MEGPIVERMRAADLDEVLAIERVSFSNPWSRQAFLYELRDNRVAHLWVARVPEATPDGPGRGAPRARVAGYLGLWFIVDEIHVTNFAVHPADRRRGVGRHLLGTLLEHYRHQGAGRTTLEVRPTNLEARRLYEQFGFYQIAVRKGYYFDTGEDALVLEASLAASSWPRLAEAGGTRPSTRVEP